MTTLSRFERLHLILSSSQSSDEKLQSALYDWSQEEQSIPISPSSDTSIFRSWLVTNGAKIHPSLSIFSSSIGWGIQTNSLLHAQDHLVSIPSSLLMISPFIHPIFSSIPSAALILTLIFHDLSLNSFFLPYIMILPRIHYLSMYFSPAQLSLLKGTGVYKEAMKDNLGQYKLYMLLFKALQNSNFGIPIESFTFSKFQWARAVVLTRQNEVIVDGRPTLCLAPFYDMFNHVHGEITAHYDTKEMTLELACGVEVDKGNQVFMSYGDR